MDTTLARAPVGQVLDGRYRVESLIARGGMATVYLGTDTRLDRTVALKIMHPELANDEDFVRRFVGEARSVARLSHPNVVGVYDQGADGRILFLAMEYVPGQTLRDLLNDRGRLSPREALDIIEGVLSGLAAAHAAGLVHRDVKPENVLLTDRHAVKVADFGLARMLAGNTHHTKTGLLIGTAAYLAPEQVSRGAADARTDVYATGIMLFELLTGIQPHTAETPLAVAYKHVNEVVPAPSRFVPGLPAALDSLVALATSRDPELRPGDAGQYLRAVTESRRSVPLDGPGTPGSARDDFAGHRAGTPWTQAGPAALASTAVQAFAHPPTPQPPGSQPPALPHSPATQLPAAQPADWAAGAPTRYGAGIVPGLDVTARQPSGPPGTGGPDFGGPDFGGPDFGGPDFGAPDRTRAGDDFYRSANHTLVVASPGPGQDYHPGRRGFHGAGSGLQHWLFSRRLIYVLGGLAAVLLIGLLVWWQTAGQYASIPQVRGMLSSTAQLELHNEGLNTKVVRFRFDNQVAKGNVISTSPASGSQVAKGTTVSLVVSDGPHLIAVPQVTGASLNDAKAALRQAGLVPGQVVNQTSTTIQGGVVISTTPAAGVSWPQSKPVTLVVSAGQPVPNFVGQQKDVAEQWAQANGVSLNEVADNNSSQPAGNVTSQSLAPGSAFSNGQVITINISTGGQPTNVPNVDGMTTGQAQQALQQAGFQVNVTKLGPIDNVFNYSPSGQAPQGSVITIFVGYP